MEVAIPIIVRNHYLGSLYAGQIRWQDAPLEISRLARMFEDKLRDWPLNAAQKKMYKSIVVYEFDRFRHLAELIALVTSQFCEQVVTGHLINRDINNG